LGGESIALYPSGGTTGQLLSELLHDEGVENKFISISGLTRENFICLEESTGQQFRFGMPGPEMDSQECTRCLDELFNLDPSPGYLVASGSLPPGVGEDFYAKVADVASILNFKLILDTSGEPLHLGASAGVYLVKPNYRELADLAGQDIKEESQLDSAARQLIEEGQSEVVVISLGAAGALMFTQDGCDRIRAPQVPVQSRVGAGDSMVAGMVLSLAREKPLPQAVRFGVAAGAAAVMTPGTELCRREDAERLYEAMISE
jgi:6-phosphofructokinase 2